MVGKKRKRGGQPGNLNALKHGFYSRQFRDQEIQDLEDVDAAGLKDEIAMMRVMARRLMEMSMGCQDLDQLVSVVGALGMASSRLASMLRTERFLEKNKSVVDELTQAITEAAIEFGFMDRSEVDKDETE